VCVNGVTGETVEATSGINADVAWAPFSTGQGGAFSKSRSVPSNVWVCGVGFETDSAGVS
jgi:hypothetical protein